MEYFTCPACQRKAPRKHYEDRAGKTELWFGCQHDPCRHHFKVLRMSGWPDQIVADSLRAAQKPLVKALGSDGLVVRMGCPTCNRHGPIKMTMPQRDGSKWRRHVCPTCGPYYTHQTSEGVTVHRKKKSKKAIDLFGEDDAA